MRNAPDIADNRGDSRDHHFKQMVLRRFEHLGILLFFVALTALGSFILTFNSHNERDSFKNNTSNIIYEVGKV